MKVNLEKLKKDFVEQRFEINPELKTQILSNFYKEHNCTVQQPAYLSAKKLELSQTLTQEELEKLNLTNEELERLKLAKEELREIKLANEENKKQALEQMEAICAKMKEFGFTKFPDLINKFAGEQEYVANQIKDTTESIFFVFLSKSDTDRKKLAVKYADRNFMCGPGTLTNLQKILQEITLGEQGITSYLALQKRQVIEQIIIEMIKTNHFQTNVIAREWGGHEVHNIPSMVNLIADEFGLQKKTKDEDQFMFGFKEISNDMEEYDRKVAEKFNLDLTRDIQKLTAKLNQELQNPEVFDALLNMVVELMITNLPFFGEDFNKITQDRNTIQEQILEIFENFGLGEISFLKDEFHHQAIITVKDYESQNYKRNAFETLKAASIIYFNEQEVIQAENIDLLKLKVELENELDEDACNQQVSLNTLQKFQDIGQLKPTIQSLIENNLKVQKEGANSMLAIEYAVSNNIFNQEEILDLLMSRNLEEDEFKVISRWVQEGKISIENRKEFFLINAIHFGDVALISKLIDLGINLSSHLTNGKLPISIAVDAKQKDVLDLLIKNGCDINQVFQNGKTLLFEAVTSKNLAAIELLIKKGADVNQKFTHDETLLFEAIRQESLEVVEILVKNGADVNAKNNLDLIYYFNTPLEKVLSLIREAEYQNQQEAVSRNLKIMEVLLANKADYKSSHIAQIIINLDIKVSSKILELINDPIYFLSFITDPKTYPNYFEANPLAAQLILQQAEEYEKSLPEDAEERRALNGLKQLTLEKQFFSAIKKNDLELIKKLLESGVDINCKNYFGETPLIALIPKFNEEIFEFLLENGADINAKSHNGETAFHKALSKYDPEIVNKILAKKPEIDLHGFVNHRSILEYALKYGNYEIAKFLLSQGANIFGEEKGVDYSLLYAIEQGYIDIVQELLDKGANVNSLYSVVDASGIHDKERKTSALYRALSLVSKGYIKESNGYFAKRDTYKKIARLLLEKGADINNNIDRYSWNTLTVACATKDEIIIDAVLAKIDYYDHDKVLVRGHETHPLISLLHWNKKYFKQLLAKDGDINCTINSHLSKYSLLYFAETPDDVKFLLENGASITPDELHDVYPLNKFLRDKKYEQAFLLLQHGANVNYCQSDKGKLPPIITMLKSEAFNQDSKPFLITLFLTGANLSYKTNDFKGILDYFSMLEQARGVLLSEIQAMKDTAEKLIKLENRINEKLLNPLEKELTGENNEKIIANCSRYLKECFRSKEDSEFRAHHLLKANAKNSTLPLKLYCVEEFFQKVEKQIQANNSKGNSIFSFAYQYFYGPDNTDILMLQEQKNKFYEELSKTLPLQSLISESYVSKEQARDIGVNQR
ncbi:MAG: hypothetical protein K0R73_523 [Candidatus Midichloriaceae bacterium]|jgi:ankyrin repeat protein|nr:hypothetical protein [Candidatus Midichloriaceae bacterium]